MRKHLALLLATCCIGLLASAVALAEEDSDSQELKPIEPAKVELDGPVDFERDVYPILEANCIACHNLGINESSLVLEDVESILKGGDSGPGVVAGDPDASLIYQVASRSIDPAMPPLPNEAEAQALTPEQLGMLRLWISEGANAGSGSSGAIVSWQPLPSGLRAIYSVALTRSGRFAAAGRVNQIEVIDLATGQKTAQLVDPHLADVMHNDARMYPGGAAHRDFVHSLAFSPNGQWLASGGFRVVKLWQRQQNLQKSRTELAAPVTAVAVSPDGSLIASALTDHSIAITNPADPASNKTLVGHNATVSGLVYLAGTKLVSASHDKTIRIWNPADGAAIAQIDTPAAIHSVAVHPDAGRIVTAHADQIIRVWNFPADAAESAPPVLEIAGHEKAVTSIAIIPSAGTHLVSGSEDGSVRLWTLADGKQTQSLSHGGAVTNVAARLDGQVVASCGVDGLIKLWQISDGKLLAEFKGDLARDAALVNATEDQQLAKQLVTLAQNAVQAAEKGVTDREAELKTAQETKTNADKALAEAQPKQKPEQEKVDAAKAELAKDPENEELKKKVTEAEKALQAATDAIKKATEAQASAQRAVELGEKTLANAKQNLERRGARKTEVDEHQKQIDAKLAEAQQAANSAVQSVRALAFSPDGRSLVSAGDDQLVHQWDATTGRALDTFAGHQAPVSAVGFAADGSIISAGGDKAVVVWNLTPGWRLAGQLGAPADAPLDLSASPFFGRVLAIDFSPDGKLLATGGGDPSRSGELAIWNLEDRSLLRKFQDAHSDTVLGVQFSRDGKSLLSGAADKFVKVFDVESGNHVRSFEGHTHHVLDVSWKADGTAIASAGADNQIKIWTVETGEQQRTIGGHGKQVTSIEYVGIGAQVVSCGGDKSVRLHNTGNGKQDRAFGGATDFVYDAAMSRDSSLVVAGGEDGVLRVWNGADGKSKWNFEPPKPVVSDEAQASAAQ